MSKYYVFYVSTVFCIPIRSYILCIAILAIIGVIPGLFIQDYFYVSLSALFIHSCLSYIFVRYATLEYLTIIIIFFINLFVQLGLTIYTLCIFIIHPQESMISDIVGKTLCAVGITHLVICLFLVYNLMMTIIFERVNEDERITDPLPGSEVDSKISNLDVEPVKYVNINS